MSPRVPDPNNDGLQTDGCSVVSASFQYLYFLRVSLLLWLALPLLALLDAITDLSALTRGIFTPPVEYAFGAAEFFVICLGMVSLLTARIVCINGQSRFKTEPPAWIQRSLGNRSEEWAWRTLFFFQLPGLFVIYRYHRNAHIEQEVTNLWIELAWTVVGIVAAVLFWKLINNLYYWASCLQPQPKKAAILLWPQHHQQQIPAEKALEVPLVLKPLVAIFHFIAARGDGYSADGKTLYEGHQLATIGALGYFATYLVLAPITAPTRQSLYTTIDLILLAAVAGFVGWSITKVSNSRKLSLRAGAWLTGALVLVAFIAIASAIATSRSPAFASEIWFEHFPVIVAVTVLITSFTFLFTGIAFWADRHRIPVMTLSLVGISALQFAIHTVCRVSGEHYFQVLQTPVQIRPVRPLDAYDYYRDVACKNNKACPLIIVTASGGGIHAAAWTATVLTELEKQFAAADPKFLFHDHILLISSVSGGSVGTMPFLREYYAPSPFDESKRPPCDRTTKEGCPEPYWSGQVRRSAFCSSLGGVGWGLEYGDLLRLLAPELPYVNHLTDRSQALEETLRRNLTDKGCDPTYGDDRFGSEDGIDHLTLVQMMGDLIGAAPNRPRIPAFVFNSTIAETGDRFLFSNYENGRYGYASYGVAPSDSWLSEYYELAPSHPDLRLVTAARLSATFPYVSSAARADGLKANQAQHFVDGGYFDNDGTSSAIEFLEQLFPPPIPDDERSDPKPPPPPVVPILFIEIRDGSDLPINSDDDLTWNSDKKAGDSWTAASETVAPIKAFWSAGHSSITLRNRRELQLLMQTLGDRNVAKVTHIVFDYVEPKSLPKLGVAAKPIDHEAAQPLSWHLTSNQESEIRDSFKNLSNCSSRAVYWAKTAGLNLRYPGGPRPIEVQCDQKMNDNPAYREPEIIPIK